MPPARIGHYRVDRVIAVGGMGAVYLAYDEQLDRPVAIKGLIGDDASSERRERLRREALATAALSHPAIAHVYEIVTEANRDWLVMELIEGTTLADVVLKGPLPAAEVARIGEDVASALAHAHSHGIVHRDIKLENVMLTPSGSVKVLDFGLALRLGEANGGGARLTSDGTVVGTARAMAPEQALGRATDARSDIFALGSLLYELATGRPAFDGVGPAEVMVKVARNERLPVHKASPRVPQGLAGVIERCLQTEPAHRFATASEVGAALRRLAEPTRATLAFDRTRTLLGAGTWPRRFWTIGGLALLAAAAAAVIAVRSGWISPRPALTVAVLPADVEGAAGALRLARAAVADAVASNLARLEGVSVVAGREVRTAVGPGKPLSVLAAELGVRELVRATITPSSTPGQARIRLSRISGADGSELWSERLEVATDDLMLIEDRITTALADAYRDFTRGDAGDRGVTPEALAAYLEAISRLDSGQVSAGYTEEIALLDRAVELAPRFVRALTTLASIHRYLFENANDISHRELAERALARAERVDPSAPDVLRRRIELATARGDVAPALDLARRLVEARPGSDQAWLQLGYAQKGVFDLAAAATSFQRAFALRPSWQPLLGLADVRMLGADYDGARQAIDELQRRWPGNLVALRKRAEIEMYAGDFAAGERTARKVHAATGAPSDLINLANCVYFQGRFAEAAASYREAAEAAPANPLPLANLADALLAAGDVAGARRTYAAALQLCDRQLDSGRRTPVALLRRALCLAELGRASEAALTIEEGLRRFPGNPETTAMAALVAALAGDRASCVAWTRQSLALHAPAAWFGGPEFATMRHEPAFAALFPAGVPTLAASATAE